MRAALFVGLLIGDTPTPPQGLPCGDGESCPSGQRCFDGFCSINAPPGADPDSRILDDSDAQGDGPSQPMSLRFGERSDAIAETMVDTFLVSEATDSVNNFGRHLDLHLTSGSLDPILVRVDLTSIPQNATVKSATLVLEVTFNKVEDQGSRVRSQRIVDRGFGWVRAMTPPVSRTSSSVTRTSCGLAMAPPRPRGSAPAGTTMVNALIDVGSDLQIDIPAELVQSWVNDPANNDGLALIVDGQDFYCELGSSEATDEFNRPFLQVEIE